MVEIQKKLIEFSQNTTLLYVEDDKETRKQYGEVFKLLFKDLTLATDGQDALEKYQEKQYDIVITDLTMPRMNGVELIENIKKINREQHVIIMTAHNTDTNLRSSIEFQIDGFLLKPVAIDKLFFLLHKVCKLIALEKKDRYMDDLDLTKILSGEKNALFLVVIDNFNELLYEFGDIVKTPIMDKAKKHLKSFNISEECFINPIHGIGLCGIDKGYIDNITSSFEEFLKRKNVINVELGNMSINISISYGIIISKQGMKYANDNKAQFLASIYIFAQEIRSSSDNFSIINMDMELSKAKKQNSLKWLANTIEALEQENIVPHYQKIVDINTLETVSYEIYSRIKQDGKYILPEFFIDLSQKAGILEELSKSVFDKAFKKMGDTEFEIHVNLHYLELSYKVIEDYIVYLCSMYSVEHSKVVLNVLNFQISSIPEKSLEALLDFKKLGFKIALKDFTAIGIDIEMIAMLEPEYIKIKQAVVEKSLQNLRMKNALSFLISYAKEFSIKTILVEVESHDILEEGRALGFDYVQGYLIEEPNDEL